jgi:hypothetical protein
MSSTAISGGQLLPARSRLLHLAMNLRRNPRLQPLLKGLFKTMQRAGVNVTPKHFYWPIPDLAELEHREWPTARQPTGVDLRLSAQQAFLKNIAAGYATEFQYRRSPNGAPYAYHSNNGLFEPVDAEVLYAMVRHHKPRRMIEIGGGYSTRVTTQALRENLKRDGVECELTTIEPCPDPVLTGGIPGLTRLIAKQVQEVPLPLFESLRAGDILFIDSSHVVSIGNDVIYEYLEILPRLKPGVIVHAHDIFLPSDYPRSTVVESFCFWSEQYLLQAFLAFNSSFEVLWSSSAMQAFDPTALEAAFPNWTNSYLQIEPKRRQFVPTADGKRVWPSSFWMRRTQ